MGNFLGQVLGFVAFVGVVYLMYAKFTGKSVKEAIDQLKDKVDELKNK